MPLGIKRLGLEIIERSSRFGGHVGEDSAEFVRAVANSAHIGVCDVQVLDLHADLRFEVECLRDRLLTLALDDEACGQHAWSDRDEVERHGAQCHASAAGRDGSTTEPRKGGTFCCGSG